MKICVFVTYHTVGKGDEVIPGGWHHSSGWRRDSDNRALVLDRAVYNRSHPDCLAKLLEKHGLKPEDVDHFVIYWGHSDRSPYLPDSISVSKITFAPCLCCARHKGSLLKEEFPGANVMPGECRGRDNMKRLYDYFMMDGIIPRF